MTVESAGHGEGFDVHGLAAVALVDATQDDAAAVGRQLGGSPRPLDRPADLTLRYVERLELPGLRSIGREGAGVAGDRFVVLAGRGGRSVRVVLPLDDVGRGAELVLQHGTGPVPFLVALVNLVVSGNGGVALHASAFEWNDIGVVTTGWSKGGKTELLLGALDRGARFVADEWAYLDPGGSVVGGLLEPVRIWSWHVDAAPGYGAHIGRATRARMSAATATMRRLEAVGRGDGAVGLAARKLAPLLDRQQGTDVRVADLVGDPNPVGPFDHLVLTVAGSEGPPRVVAVDPLEVADRAAWSLDHERRQLLDLHRVFCAAFPDRVNELLVDARERERDRLRLLFAPKPALRIDHPYPVPIAESTEVLLTALESAPPA